MHCASHCFIAVAESSSTTPSLFGSKIKVEPIDPVYDDEDDCMSDEYGDGYAAYDGDGYDEDETFCQSKYIATSVRLTYLLMVC